MGKEKRIIFTGLKRWYHYIFGEKFFKKLDFKWQQFPNRCQIIQDTIDRKNYKNYLEIGCFNDELFSKIKIETKIGVDPVSGGTIRDSSDNFFKKNNIKFDIIFIDGLHEYDQVKKDIINSLLFLNNNGVIFLHDCMPRSYLHQAVPRATGVWNGDVWKNIVESRTKSEIDTYVVHADQGIGVILKRPNKKLLQLNTNNFKKLKFRDFFYNYRNYLNIVDHKDLINIF
jgi:hypothetical protein